MQAPSSSTAQPQHDGSAHATTGARAPPPPSAARSMVQGGNRVVDAQGVVIYQCFGHGLELCTACGIDNIAMNESARNVQARIRAAMAPREGVQRLPVGTKVRFRGLHRVVQGISMCQDPDQEFCGLQCYELQGTGRSSEAEQVPVVDVHDEWEVLHNGTYVAAQEALC
ncbi:hypothetical protein JKP88DRAFT_221491 [Tribonema minus]|uniref:Uncharacterized protein n=1 Tax=Tribonema minus TaxID=303371 RepID=A0A836CEE5_9STRA|nr:hypothetical protein JKP88DRAFT_221491 [Tribonema minus]